jgi:ligand-binding sensor domain-containing protein/signal transduction histidine kinase
MRLQMDKTLRGQSKYKCFHLHLKTSQRGVEKMMTINNKGELKALLVIFCLISISILNLQGNGNIHFNHLSLEDGLSQSTVYCILQDKTGFIWLGTQEGLNRYDGNEFKHYKQIPGDKKSLSNSYILCIYESKNSKTLWIGTDGGGLCGLDLETEKFKRYKYLSKEEKPNFGKLSDNVVRTICEDSKGNVWIGTGEGGLNKLEPNTGKFTYYLGNFDIRALYIDKSNTLWIGTYEHGLYKMENCKGEPKLYESSIKNVKNLKINRIMAICQSKEGTIWVGTDSNGLYEIEKENGFTKANSLGNNKILSLYKDRSDTLWVGTNGSGLFKLIDQEKRTFEGCQHNAAKSYSLSHNVVHSIFEDRTGGLWVGTYSGGLNFYNPKSRHFALFEHEQGDDNSMSSSDIRSIYRDKAGFLWVGTFDAGLNIFSNNEMKKILQTQKHLLKNEDIRVIIEDNIDKGIFWIGTGGGGLYKLKRNDYGKIINMEHFLNKVEGKDNLKTNWIQTICNDKNEKHILWIGTQGGGLFKFNKNTNSFEQALKDKLDYNIIFYLLMNDSKTLWIGTREGGLHCYNKDTGELKSYQHNSKKTNLENPSLSHNHVLCIFEDKDGVLWVGTYGGGLNKLVDRDKGTFKSYRKGDGSGLPNSTIYGILQDDEGFLWLSTNNGISMFDPNKRISKSNSKIGKAIRNYEVFDGLQGNEFNSGAFFKYEFIEGESKKEKMYFGGLKGLIAFNPAEIKKDQNKRIPVVITNFLLKGIPVQVGEKNSLLEKVIHETKEITLSYDENSFSFEFATLHYANPKKNRYKYMLEKHDNAWIPADSKHFRATYANLNEGTYVFKVKGSNSDTVWSENVAAIKIKIHPPFWRTWWAYTLYILAFIGILILVWKAWSQRILKRKLDEQKKELKKTQMQLIQSEKMRALGDLVANIAHEINNPASFVRTTSYNLKRDLEKFKSFLMELAGEDADEEIRDAFDEKFSELFKHLVTMDEGTARIGDIVKDLKTFSRMEPGEKKRVDIKNGLMATVSLVKSKYKNQIDFETDRLAPIDVKGNLAELNQVFMNIIQNACQSIIEKQDKSGDKTKGILAIETHRENGNAVVIFKDTGVGIPKDVKDKLFDPFFSTKPIGEGIGLGLSVSYGIIKDHNGNIQVDSKEGNGTSVTVYLPLFKIGCDDTMSLKSPKCKKGCATEDKQNSTNSRDLKNQNLRNTVEEITKSLTEKEYELEHTQMILARW